MNSAGNLIEALLKRLQLIVGRCVISASRYKDGELLADIELVAGEKRRAVEFLQQFGFSSRPKGDVEGIALFVGGSRDNGVVVATRGECPDLKEGEVRVHSPFGSSITLKEDGSILSVPASGKKFIVASDLLVRGKMLGTGDVVAGVNEAGEEVVETGGVSLKTHVHPTAVIGPASMPTPIAGG